jgi:hypothetical protein
LDTLDQNNNEGYRRIENNPNQQQAWGSIWIE